jgi:hypothetical protein
MQVIDTEPVSTDSDAVVDARGGNRWADQVPPKAGVVGVILELELAEKLGLNQNRLRKVRKALTVPGVDWYHEGHGRFCRVIWTDSGLSKVQDALGVVISKVVPVGEEMIVVRSGYVNKRVILCRRSNGQEVIVQVKDSSNYRSFLTNGKPMQVRARWTGEVWVAEGRPPRQVGRW